MPTQQAKQDEDVAPNPPRVSHSELSAWVESVAGLTQPEFVVWCDGSDAEWKRLSARMVETGALVRLNPQCRPNSFYARSAVSDVARVEDRTFVCSDREEDAGPTNNWVDPVIMRRRLSALFDGCMRGRTLYVVPFCMGPPGSDHSLIGVEITDSPYVVLSMRIMARIGTLVLEMLGEDGFFVRCVHSVGAPLAPGEADVTWPCSDEKWIVHYPTNREVWSYGSGYGGNALLGKKCLALRIASVMAREQGWLAEHMLIIKVTSPERQYRYIAGAFPSACGKTNLAMIGSKLPGWHVETIGDDIAWIRLGPDGRFYAINPEAGFFGVAPGTGPTTNHNATETLKANCIFTNTALTAEGDVWWEGLTDQPPDALTDWTGAPWDPGESRPAAHPNARFTVPAEQCPSIAAEWDQPEGVVISAFVFGGRRATTVPLALEAFDWDHGVYLAANMASEGTAAAENELGKLRRDPFAMLPFCGYHIGNYLTHWSRIGAIASRDGQTLPKIFMVNWFQKGADGRFLWPGYDENIRVLRWIHERIENKGEAVETAIGLVPTSDAIGMSELGLSPDAAETLLSVDREVWKSELRRNRDYLDSLGSPVPALAHQQARLEQRVASA